LGGVEAVTLIRRVRTVHAVAVALAGADTRQVAVPVEGGHLTQRHPLLAVAAVEQTQLDPLGVLREQGEVRPLPVPHRAQRERRTRPHRGHATTAPASAGSWTPPSASRASCVDSSTLVPSAGTLAG